MSTPLPANIKPRMSPFQKKITFYGSGGPFLDGYVIVIVGIALTQISPQWNLTAAQNGAIGAAALFGLMIGGLIFGYVTDRVGREVMYVIDIIAICALSIFQAFAQDPMQLIIYRLLMGIAIGADYPIATSLVSEFSTREHRGFMVGVIDLMWYVGAVVAAVVGFALLNLGDDGWRWMFASAAFPGVLLLLGRLGTPESPRWLANQGRKDEAKAVLKKVFGTGTDISEFLAEIDQPMVKTKFTKILTGKYLGRSLFCGIFWMLMVIPLFALYTFGPQIFEALHITAGLWIEIINNLFFTIGCIPALLLISRVGRRPVIVWCFAFMTVGLLLVAFAGTSMLWLIILGLTVFAVATGGPGILSWVYPNELFPTEVRASATGLATGISRLGSAVGTYFVPTMIVSLGIQVTMFIMAGLCLIGWILCFFMAPETMGKTLAEASSVGE